MPSGPADLLFLMDFAAREISSKEGVAASSWIYGNVGSFSKMDGSDGLTWLRRSLKCSAHLVRIPYLSLISKAPSAERTGTHELRAGP